MQAPPPTSEKEFDGAASGIRFGHLTSLRVIGEDAVESTTRTGEVVEFEGGSTDLGGSIREIIVDVPGRRAIELDWTDLDRIDFSAAPSGAPAYARRLYGTLEDRDGNRFTGYVSWDLDEILEYDVLDGEDLRSGDDMDIRFSQITSIAHVDGLARVVLVNRNEAGCGWATDRVSDSGRCTRITSGRMTS